MKLAVKQGNLLDVQSGIIIHRAKVYDVSLDRIIVWEL